LREASFIHGGASVRGKEVNGELFDSFGKHYTKNEVVWLPPSNPTKIIGLVLNYRDHANELGLSVVEEPVIFLKPPSALTGNLGEIVYPAGTKYMHYEAELCVIIGRKARYVSSGGAMDFVRGYTIANDVTVRDFITNTFRPPVKAKGFDTFCPVGPYLITADEVADPSNLKITTRVNGEVRQEGNTKDLMHTIPQLIEYLSSFMTLYPEDMILTGTPKGISPIAPGDNVEIEIDHLGRLVNRVVAEKDRNGRPEVSK
jgi:5-oxopent-3-ene-1,2,5-tricarboxylate decarboxylase / 2-hydroxyhepta-2,4-diene-1,7-dioate isomerase